MGMMLHLLLELVFSELIIWLAPESVADLEEFVLKFFRGLPPVTIASISMLGDGFASLLRQLLPYNPPTQAWIMISCLYLDSIPVVVALAVDSFPAEEKEASEASWTYYWDHSIIDEVAPEFRSILSSNHLTSRQCMTTYEKEAWWKAKGDLDQSLCTLLCNMEEKWFGPWIYLLLADCNHVDSSVSKRLKKGCYVGGIGYDHEQSPTGLRVSSLIPDAVKESEDEGDPVRAKAVILVLDMDIEMLPWENLPNLRKQEIYRMPSVAGISSTYLKCQGKKIGEDFAFSTEIDPRSSYYLVNPCKNLAGLERQMAEWLLDKGLKGEAGVIPTREELKRALKTHDLFLYLGHRDGLKYIPAEEIRSIQSCGAATLFGCCSALLKVEGPYRPNARWTLYALYIG